MQYICKLLLLLVRMMIRTPLFDEVKSLVKSGANSPKQAGDLGLQRRPCRHATYKQILKKTTIKDMSEHLLLQF